MTESRQSTLAQKNVYVSFVVPVHNEEAGLQKFVQALCDTASALTHHFDILLINDGSTDSTLAVIEKELLPSPIGQKHLKLLSFSRNFGKENALTAGLQHARGDVVVILDADFQHPLSCIAGFLERWAQGFDMVYGLRESRHNETWFKRSFTKFFYRMIDILSATDIPANAGDFRLLDRKVVDAMNLCGEYNRFMKGLYAWVGFKSTPILYRAEDRDSGESSFSFFKLFDLALTGIVSFSDVPLRVWSIIGFFISSIAFIYGLFVMIKTMIHPDIAHGFPTLIVAILFLGGVQLISIGVLGEYLARIFREVKNRPRYILDKKIGFDEPAA